MPILLPTLLVCRSAARGTTCRTSSSPARIWTKFTYLQLQPQARQDPLPPRSTSARESATPSNWRADRSNAAKSTRSLFLWEQSVFSRVIHSNTTKLTFPDFERACLYNHGTKRPATHSGCFFSSKSTLTRVCVLELYCCGDKRGYFACNPEFPDANPSEKAYMWWIYHTFPPSLRQIYWFLKSSLSNPNIPL